MIHDVVHQVSNTWIRDLKYELYTYWHEKEAVLLYLLRFPGGLPRVTPSTLCAFPERPNSRLYQLIMSKEPFYALRSTLFPPPPCPARPLLLDLFGEWRTGYVRTPKCPSNKPHGFAGSLSLRNTSLHLAGAIRLVCHHFARALGVTALATALTRTLAGRRVKCNGAQFEEFVPWNSEGGTPWNQ